MIKKDSNFFLSNRFFIFLIILVLIIIYFNSFFHGVIFLDDDTLIYTKFQGMGTGERISLSFTSNYLDNHYYRPVTLLSLITDSLIAGQSYFIYHFTNFIIHLSTSILIFLILLELGISNIISFFTALFFALSPIQINTVGWIAGRGDLLAAFFSAAALLIYINFIKQDKPYLLIFVSFLLFLAILSKEAALPVPFLFIGLYFIEKNNYKLNKNSFAILMMLIAVLGSYYILRGLFLTDVYIDKFSFTTYYRNILILPETVSKFFIPAGIKALAGIDSFTTVSGTFLLIILSGLPLQLKSVNKARYYFGLLWFIILLLPGMVFRTMGQDGFYYWDCRSYLPAIGFMFMISEVITVFTKQRIRYTYFALPVIYLLILGSVTFIKIKLYASPLTYWDAVKADYRSSFLPYVGLFNYYSFKEDRANAEKQLLQAINLRPEELSIRINLFNYYEKQNSVNKAFRLLKKTLINDKMYSDYLAARYLTLSNDPGHSEEADNLFKTYNGDKIILEKIRRIASGLNEKNSYSDNH